MWLYFRTHRALFVAGLLAAGTVMCGDRETLPGAPSDLTAGVVIFQHANYLGKSAHLEREISDLSKFEGPCEHESGGEYSTTSYDWDDCVSSIRVSPATRAVVFVNTNFQGFGRTIDQDVPNLQLLVGPCSEASLNDCVSSIRVMPR